MSQLAAQLGEAKKRLNTFGFVAPELRAERLQLIEECIDNALSLLPDSPEERLAHLQKHCAGLQAEAKKRFENPPDSQRVAVALESIAKSLESIALAVDSTDNHWRLADNIETIAMAMDGDSGRTIGQSAEKMAEDP